MNQLLTTEQAAKYVGVRPKQMQGWRHDKTGPRFIRLNSKTVRYRMTDLDEWVKSKQVNPQEIAR